jgi:hypothetical protein
LRLPEAGIDSRATDGSPPRMIKSRPRWGAGYDNRGGEPHDSSVLLVFCCPVEEEQQRVDLVVVSPMWECKQFLFEVCQPISLIRQQDAAGFETALMARQSGDFIVPGAAAEDVEGRPLFLDHLNQPGAARRVLNEDGIRLRVRREPHDTSQDFPHVPMTASYPKDMEHVVDEAE